MPLIESNVHGVWASKQSAKGTPATVATQRFKLVGGTTMTANLDMGSTPYSDGTAWGDATDFLNSLIAQGQPAFEAGTDQLAWLLWLFHGTETVTPSGTNAVQTLTVTGAPTGGTVPLSYDGRSTTVPFNATAAAVQTALEGLGNIGTGNVACAGGPLPAAVTITFQGALAKRPVPVIVTGSTGLTGGTSPTGVIANTTPGANATHTFAPSNGLGFWSTWWQTVGANTQQKLKHNDVRLGGLQIEASSGTKDLQVSPQFLGLDPAEQYTTDPTPGMPTAPVLLFTEGAGSFQVDSTTILAMSQMQIQLAYNLSPVFGDNVTPYDIARGTPTAVVTCTAEADDVMVGRWNNWLYGTPTPSAGTKPILRLPPLGSFGANFTKKDSAGNTIGSFQATVPGVRWQIPDSVAPNPGQGSGQMSLTGSFRLLGSNPLYSMAVGCQAAAFTG